MIKPSTNGPLSSEKAAREALRIIAFEVIIMTCGENIAAQNPEKNVEIMIIDHNRHVTPATENPLATFSRAGVTAI